MKGASCLSDPLHFIPDRLWGLQVVAEGAAEPELRQGFVRRWGSRQDRPEPDNSQGHRSSETQGERANESVLS